MGRTVRQKNCAPREPSFPALSKASKTRRLNASQEAQTSEILFKPMEEQNPRLTTGSSPVYPKASRKRRFNVSPKAPVESKNRQTTGGSGRSARWSGQAGSGKIECQQKDLPRKQKTTVPSKAWKRRPFNVSPEARTSEFLCKTTEERNQRLTRG